MKLAAWMKQQGLRDREVGEGIGVSDAQVSRIRRGVSVPSIKTQKAIARFTSNAVMPNDFADIADAACTTPIGGSTGQAA